MYIFKKEFRMSDNGKGQSPCRHFVKMFHDRWKPYILIAICREGSFSPKAAAERWNDASVTDLSLQFRQLEDDRLIMKTDAEDFEERSEYQLTESGKCAVPILEAIYEYAVGDMKEKGIAVDQRALDYYEPALTDLKNENRQ